MNKYNQNSDDLERQHSDLSDDGISPSAILSFLKGGYKIILVAWVIGFGISIIFLMVTPSQYLATAQIAMAQIDSNVGGGNNGKGLNPLGVNIEEPSLLIIRLSSPTSFTPQVLTSCGLEDRPESAAGLSKSIKLTLPKGVPNVVELRTFGPTPQIAYACADAVFDLIKLSQSQISAPYINEASIKLADDEERLGRAKDLIAKADKSGQGIGATYLATRDEVRYLLDEITALKNIIASSKSRSARLIAPIYTAQGAVAPKKIMTLIAGSFFGIFLGILLVLVRRMWFWKNIKG